MPNTKSHDGIWSLVGDVGGELKWLLCDNDIDWKKKLTILINDKDLRDHYGNMMYDVAFKHFNIANISANWWYAFNKVLNA